MSLRWDSLLVRHVARELDDALSGARLRAIRLDGATRDLFLLFRDWTLVWRLHPTRGYPLLRPAVEPAASDLVFASRLRRVDAPPDERLVRFELLPARAGRPARDVIVELYGNQWNALVLEGQQATLRHVLWTRQGPHARQVGATYAPPAAGGRLGARGGELSLEQFTGLLLDVPPPERAAALVRAVAWTSPVNADWILGEAGVDDVRAPTAAPGRDHSAALAAAHARWLQLADPEAVPNPGLLDTARGPQPYPLPLPPLPHAPLPSLLAALERLADDEPQGTPAAAASLLPPEWAQALEREAERAARRVHRLEAEARELPDPQALRSVADLVLARYSEIRAGAAEARLRGFDGNEVVVRLDPSLPVHENATRYYREAARAERAHRRLPGLVVAAREEWRRLVALQERAGLGEADPAEVAALLPTASSRVADTAAGAPLPYRIFRSSGGLEIRVGRGARHNDDLTFRHSSPGDVWLHARHASGAHVVLRWSGPGGPPARDLEEAATLAALHSKARTSTSVPVDWTLRKYVRKPKGAAPGSVRIERARTVFVRPDHALAEALAEP